MDIYIRNISFMKLSSWHQGLTAAWAWLKRNVFKKKNWVVRFGFDGGRWAMTSPLPKRRRRRRRRRRVEGDGESSSSFIQGHHTVISCSVSSSSTRCVCFFFFWCVSFRCRSCLFVELSKKLMNYELSLSLFFFFSLVIVWGFCTGTLQRVCIIMTISE